jgi:homoserine dehydrogenase
VGIVNGTCNFILTRMLEAGSSYAHALGQAQRLGFAEADPALDVQGIDSAHKLVILASLALRQACRVEQVEVRGITDVELTDLCAGRELGYACKLLASARRREGGIELTVCPTFVPLSHPLASVGGPVNAVSLYGDRSGPVFLSGLGAGGRATASAVVSDILDVACGNAARTFETWRDLPDQTSAASAAPRGESVSPHYIRFNLLDRPGAIGRVAAALGDAGLSIATIVQHEPPQEGGLRTVPVVVTTHPAARARLGEALSRLANWEGSVGAPVSIPVFTE